MNPTVRPETLAVAVSPATTSRGGPHAQNGEIVGHSTACRGRARCRRRAGRLRRRIDERHVESHQRAIDTKDLSRLTELASTLKGVPADIAKIHASDKHWHFHRCSPDGVYTACAWDNNNGDEFSFDIDPTLLGKPHATEGSSMEPTEFGSTADATVS